MKHVIKDYFNPEPKVVGIDFDGVLVPAKHHLTDFDDLDLLPGAKEGMEELKRQGWVIVIDSCRGDKRGIRDFLRKHGVPFDYIGVNPYAPDDTSKGKLYAHVKLDDKVEKFQSWNTAVDQINKNFEDFLRRK